MLVNLCHRPIQVVGENGVVATLPGNPDKIWASLEDEILSVEDVDGAMVPVYQEIAANVTNLPPREDGTYYVVPRRVAVAIYERDDLVFPMEVERDETGGILSCRRFRAS